MKDIVTMNERGRITIPAEMRRKLDLGINRRVRIEVEHDHINVYPVKDIPDLKGSIPARKGVYSETLLKIESRAY